MVRLLAATRLLLERRNFLLATTLASRALATTSSQLQLRPGEATSDDEKTILKLLQELLKSLRIQGVEQAAEEHSAVYDPSSNAATETRANKSEACLGT